jgi:hypothetical protein
MNNDYEKRLPPAPGGTEAYDGAAAVRRRVVEVDIAEIERRKTEFERRELERRAYLAEVAGADSIQVSGNHYKDLAVQPWHVMESVLTREEFIGFLKGNVIKYGMRQGRKEGSDDTGKALHYQQKLGEILGRNPE